MEGTIRQTHSEIKFLKRTGLNGSVPALRRLRQEIMSLILACLKKELKQIGDNFQLV